jgi:Uma2 family endonuclease
MISTPSPAFRLTVEDYFALPEGPPYFQLIDGELYISPSPNRYHQDIVLNIAAALKEHVRRTKLGHVYVAPSDVVFTDEHVLHPASIS